MDPGWPANPSNKLICILCKSAMPYHNNSERFFRHLLVDHCTYFNHNLLLEISLMQPHAVREERQSVAGRIERVAESVLDQVNVLPLKNERETTSSSSLADPDSTSNKENSINLLANTSEENLQGNFNLEETCSTARQVSVNKNNQPVPCLQDPGSKLLPFDLRMLIVRENPTRGIKFSFIQRTITQMVVDDYMLKKMKGPCLTKGGRVVNWKCTNDHCQYTAVTWEGQIQDTARHHNHPSQPELYVKKQARVKIRENMDREISNMSSTAQGENSVNNVVMDMENRQGSFNLEETCPTAQLGGSSSTNPQHSQAVYTVKPHNPPTYHSLKPAAKKASHKPDPSSKQFDPEGISDFDLSLFINQITQPDTEQSQFQPPSQLPTTSTFIPFESKPSPFLHDINPYIPTNMYTMAVAPDFGALDPISFVKQEPKTKRKVTNQVSVNKNNQPVTCRDPAARQLSDDLQMLIICENPTRGIKFSYCQGMTPQMLVDDYMLKKTEGPSLIRGGRVVNWKCTNDHCQYTAVTWEGQIQDNVQQHNHPSQTELYVKKQARVKIRENIGREISILPSTSQVESAINNVDGEFPADYQFPVEVSDQVGYYTESSTVDTDTTDTPSVAVGTDTVEPAAADTVAVEIFNEVDVPAVYDCEQVPVEDETGKRTSAIEQEIEDSTAEKSAKVINIPKIMLKEPSPTKEEPLQNVFIHE